MDPMEPQWRTNSSFSPPLSRGWDLRLQYDGSPHESCAPHTRDSSLSSHSKESGSHMNDEQYSNHHHSVSDGMLSYFGSPSNNFKVPRWTPPTQILDVEDSSTPKGARCEPSMITQHSERCLAAGVLSLSNSIGSGSPLSESAQWGSTSKGSLPPRHSISRRSFMSKPVYPLYHNPVAGNEASGLAGTSGVGRSTPIDNKASPMWPESDSSPELKFHKSLTELQKLEASPGLETSSRRQGFRWSNASSYDFGIEEGVVPESSMMENLHTLSPVDQRCGLCRRLLCQKAPSSSCRVIRNSDMPTASILSCSHVFHADCLEEMTPKTQIHEPPCPVCAGAISISESISFSEPLQVALRAARKKPGTVAISEDSPMGSNPDTESDVKRMPRRGNSLIRKHFKRHLSFKVGVGKDLFGSRMLGRKGSSSSSSTQNASKKQINCLKSGRPS